MFLNSSTCYLFILAVWKRRLHSSQIRTKKKKNLYRGNEVINFESNSIFTCVYLSSWEMFTNMKPVSLFALPTKSIFGIPSKEGAPKFAKTYNLHPPYPNWEYWITAYSLRRENGEEWNMNNIEILCLYSLLLSSTLSYIHFIDSIYLRETQQIRSFPFRLWCICENPINFKGEIYISR